MSPLSKKSLFWDTDASRIDILRHKRYVIERILKFGDMSDYIWLVATYPESEIKKVIQRDRSDLDKKSLHFWQRFYQLSDPHAS